MWHKEYRDYKPDRVNKAYPIEPGHGIIGCEMHEINGWGNQLHRPLKKDAGLLAVFFARLFGANR